MNSRVALPYGWNTEENLTRLRGGFDPGGAEDPLGAFSKTASHLSSGEPVVKRELPSVGSKHNLPPDSGILVAFCWDAVGVLTVFVPGLGAALRSRPEPAPL